MTKALNNKARLLLGIVIGFAVACYFLAPAFAAEFPTQGKSDGAYASTTAYSLAFSVSTRVVATSTRYDATGGIPETSGRTGLTLQTINCPTVNNGVFLQFNDVAAATSTGMHMAASTTRTFGDEVPMVYGSIRAMSMSAGCTLLVTEYRSL
jgi:hypothetical protein